LGVVVRSASVRQGQKNGVEVGGVYIGNSVVTGGFGHLGSVDPGKHLGSSVVDAGVGLGHLGSVDPG
jgi:hypothetical protein